MRQEVRDHHEPAPRGRLAHSGELATRVGSAVLRIGARVGALGQLCVAFAALVMLSREPANVAIQFWRYEAMIATAVSIAWVAWPRDGGRRQPVAFAAANAFGWGVSLLLPTLNH